MGSLRRPRLSESEICRLYRAGMSRYDICLRANMVDHELLAVLRTNGIPLRSDAEWRAIAEANRAAYRLRRKQRLAC